MKRVRWHEWKKAPRGETTGLWVLPGASLRPLASVLLRPGGVRVVDFAVSGTLLRLICVSKTYLQFSRETQKAETRIPHSLPSRSGPNLSFRHQPLLPNAKTSSFLSFLPCLQHASFLRQCSETGAFARQRPWSGSSSAVSRRAEGGRGPQFSAPSQFLISSMAQTVSS